MVFEANQISDYKQMEISIIIPNWKGKHLLKQNLPILFKSIGLTSYTIEVIVVDDGSKDGSVEFLEAKFPEVKLVVHEDNQGFSKACLSGVNAAKGKVVVLLNSDVQVCGDFISPLIRFFKYYDTFSVSPLVLNENGDISSVSLRIPYVKRGKLKSLKNNKNISCAKFSLYCSGGSVAYSREKFLALGGFNQIYFPFYLEDREIGMRAWRRGWKSYVEPKAKVIHPQGKTINTNFNKKYIDRIKKRNEIIFSLNNFLDNRYLYICVVSPLILKLLYKWTTFRLDYYYSFFAAIRAIPEIIKQRKEEKKAMILNEKDIFQTIRNCELKID